MQRQQHSTPVKEHTPKLQIPPFGFPPELGPDTSVVLQHPTSDQPSQTWPHPELLAWSSTAPDCSSSLQPVQTTESLVIEKQQKELELLIQELKDRDDELNDLVQIQQGQVAAWTEDRQMLLHLEEKRLQLQADIEARDQQIILLKSNLAECQSSEQEKTAQNKALELKLRQCLAECERAANHCRNLEAKISRLERSERSLQVIIAQKDAELQHISQKLETGNSESQTKLKELREALQQTQNDLKSCRKKQQDWEKEEERREGEFLKLRQENESLHSKLAAACQQIEQLGTQLQLSGEYGKRREQLLQLQRSKTERCSRELATLKEVYRHQQQELSVLKKNHNTLNSSVPLKSHSRVTPTGSQLSGTQDSKHLHHSFDSKPHENKPPTLISSKETKTESRHGPISETSALHLGDTSFVSVATTESDLSQLLNESSIERHLSEGQLKLHEGTPTHATTTWGQDGMETTRPQSAGRDSNTGTTTLHQSLSSATSGFTTRRPVSSSPPERLKLNAERSGSSRSAREHCAHNSRQTKSLSNTPLTLSVEINKTSDSKPPASSTTPDRDGGKGSSGMCAMDTGGGSPLSLDLDHLALQVRDKLSSIFDYSPTLPTEVTSSYHQVLSPAKAGRKPCDETACEDNYSTHHQTMVPAKEGKKPSMSSHLRTTREMSQTVTSGKNRPTGKSTPIKIMKPLQPVSLLGKQPTKRRSSHST